MKLSLERNTSECEIAQFYFLLFWHLNTVVIKTDFHMAILIPLVVHSTYLQYDVSTELFNTDYERCLYNNLILDLNSVSLSSIFGFLIR